jgi:hypothetical protein
MAALTFGMNVLRYESTAKLVSHPPPFTSRMRCMSFMFGAKMPLRSTKFSKFSPHDSIVALSAAAEGCIESFAAIFICFLSSGLHSCFA